MNIEKSKSIQDGLQRDFRGGTSKRNELPGLGKTGLMLIGIGSVAERMGKTVRLFQN